MTASVPDGSPVKVRWARRKDIAAIAAMSAAFRAELDEETAGLTEEALRRDGFGFKTEFDLLVAEVGSEIAGYTLFFESYEPTYSERGLYLADLYVRPEFRSHGVGRTLIACVAAESKRRQRSFVWWVALAANTRAHEFYEHIGVRPVSVKGYAAFGELFDDLAATAPRIERR